MFFFSSCRREPDSLVAHIEVSVVDFDEDVSEDHSVGQLWGKVH